MFLSSIFLLGSTILIVWYIFRGLISCFKQRRYLASHLHFFFKLLKGESLKLTILKRLQEKCRKKQKRDMFTTWLGTPAVVVFSAEAVKFLLNEPAVDERPIQYTMFKVIFGDSILLSSGERWRKQKKILRPAFHQGELKQKLFTFNKQSRKLVEELSNLKENTTNDIMNILKDSSLRTFLESLIGLKENDSFGTCFFLNFRENIRRILEFAPERAWKIWLYPEICLHIFPEGRKILKIRDELYGMTRTKLEKLKEDLLASKTDADDMNYRKPKLLGETLIEAHLKDPSFTMDDLLKETILIIAAGYETTALTCMWCLYLLGLHQDVQSRLLSDLEMLNENITYEDFRHMEYLECILKESMRIYATIPIIGRCANKDLQFGRYKIPKGRTLIIPLYVVHNNPDIYPDPVKFDPERFRYTKEGCSERLYYTPFGEGHRPCIGKTYALYFLRIMIAHIIRNFKVVSLDRQEDVEVSWEFLSHPAKPLRMQFIPRDINA